MLSRRFYAYLIDIFLVTLGTNLLLMTYLNFMDGHFHFLAPSLGKNLPKIGLFCQYLTFVGYFSLSLYISEGKTIGKLLMGLRVVGSKKESPLHLHQCFIRALGALFSTIFIMLPYFLAFLRKDERGFHDLLGNTRTIAEEPPEEKNKAFYSDNLENRIKTAL